MEKIWLNQYQQGVPAEINPDEYTSLADLFAQTCQKFADKPAFQNFGTTLSFRQLEEKSRFLAAFLQQRLQLPKGARVALMMPNILQYPVAMFAVLRAGFVVMNVNPLYTVDELVHQVNDAGAETIIVLENFAHVVAKAKAQTNLKHVIVARMGDLFPFLKAHIMNFVVKYIKRMVPSWHMTEVIGFNDALQQGAELSLGPILIAGEDIAFLQYTGGTTGVSKGAILTHRNMVANLEQISAWIKPELDVGQEIVITALPLYHIFSLTANCLVFMKSGALNILITNPRDISRFIAELAKTKFTVITGVNTLFNALINNSKITKVDFSHLKIALAGGMALQEAVAVKWEKITNHPLLEAYGLTETCPGVTIAPLNQRHFNGSIGLPIPSTDIAIRDEEGRELGIDQVGELCIKGPQVMRGYWQRPQETQLALSADGWLHTGDIARIDSKGYIYLVDRKKDMIIVSGFNVYPNEVEQVIASHPGVLEVGVVGVPSPNSGEQVKAFIVKQDPALTAEDVIAYCRKHITAYKVPKIIEFYDQLPKSNVGKILRRALRNGERVEELRS